MRRKHEIGRFGNVISWGAVFALLAFLVVPGRAQVRNYTLTYDGLGVTNLAPVPDPYPGLTNVVVNHAGRSWTGADFEDVLFVTSSGVSNRYGNLTNAAIGPIGTPTNGEPRALGSFAIAPTNTGTFVRLLSYDIASLDDNNVDEVVPWMVVHNPVFATYWLKTGTTVAGDVDNTRRTTIEMHNAGAPVDGQTNETVTLYVESNNGRVAVDNVKFQVIGPVHSLDDFFSIAPGGALSIPSPGVLTNDTLLAGAGPMTVSLLSSTSNGVLSLTNSGGFAYTPSNAPGMHGFMYRAVDGAGNTNQAAALISVPPTNGLFYDDFARPPGFVGMSPWRNSNGGTWLASNGVMRSTSLPDSPTHAYVSNNWTDYSVEVRASMPTNAYSWNVGGRLNPVTARYYGVALLPYGPGIFYHPTNSWVLRLVKFTGWDAWSGVNVNNLPDVPVGGPDTNQHTMKLTFQGNRIMVDWDGVRKIDTVDNSWEGASYTNGGITVGMYTGTNNYAVSFDDVLVTSLGVPVASNLAVQLPEDAATNLVLYGSSSASPVTFSILSNPVHGALSNFDGGAGTVTYTPFTNYFGSDAFTYLVSDGSLTATGSVNLTITPVDDPAIADNQSFFLPQNTGTNLVLTASDPDGAEAAAEFLAVTAITSPDDWTASAGTKVAAVTGADGAYIDSGGSSGTQQQFVLSDSKFIQPGDPISSVTLRSTCRRGASGSSSFRVSTVLGGSVANADSQSVSSSFADYTNTFASPPGGGAWTIAGLQNLQIRIENTTRTIDCTYFDVFVTFQGYTNRSYTILSGPAHGSISGLSTNNGTLTYTPTPDYNGPDSFTFRVNSGGVLSTGLVSIAVGISNAAPPVVANPIGTQNATYGTAFNFTFATNVFTDPDSPVLTYSATGMPPGIGFTGGTRTFAGTPTASGEYPVALVAEDNSVPALRATNTFNLNVAKAGLSITASNQSKPYGTLFSFNGDEFFTTGLKLSDMATTATLSSPGSPASATAGEYPITVTNVMGTGLSNYAISYSTGTFTVTPPEPFSITAINVTNDVATISWQSISGRVYRLEYTDLLTAPTWTEVPADIIATDTSTTTTNATGGTTNRFYRIK